MHNQVLRILIRKRQEHDHVLAILTPTSTKSPSRRHAGTCGQDDPASLLGVTANG
ncbi:hypothetical protein [Streptomyces sp. NPDC054887]